MIDFEAKLSVDPCLKATLAGDQITSMTYGILSSIAPVQNASFPAWVKTNDPFYDPTNCTRDIVYTFYTLTDCYLNYCNAHRDLTCALCADADAGCVITDEPFNFVCHTDTHKTECTNHWTSYG